MGGNPRLWYNPGVRLKSIALQGFKSFASRQTLQFPAGITAIVGPNGSGKSNIADAIRWVLGEQSLRLLRGAALEDVIFAGSEKRRPLGMAEVTIHFEGATDTLRLPYEEVSVTRRTFRSGESEFFINRAACRLKDIQEAFLDTGLGRASWALVGQGEIDAALNARPEERRLLLEETAGVARYRVQKEAALRQLEQAEADSVRLLDIAGEIETRLGPLAAASDGARRHAMLTALAATARRALLAHRSSLLEQAYRRQAGAEGAAREELEKARVTAEAAEAAREGAAEGVSAAAEALDRAREQHAAAEAALLTARHRCSLAQSGRQNVTEQLDQASAVRAEAEEADRREVDRAAWLAGEAEALRAAVEKATSALTEATTVEDEAQKAWREARERLAAARSDAGALARRAAGQREAAQTALARAAAERSQQEALAARLAELGAAVNGAAAALSAAQSAAAAAAATAEQARTLEADARQHAASAAARAAVARTAAERAQEAYREAATRHRVLAETEENLEGYFPGVRAVLAEANKPGGGRIGPGIRGAFGRLIEIPARLLTPVEVALGASTQHVVTETSDAAERAIVFLKETRAGRATFLPLADLRPVTLPAGERQLLAGAAGFMGVAAELVTAPPEAQPAVAYLLGRVLIFTALREAVVAARRWTAARGPSGIRLATLDGELLTPGGAITGGDGKRPAASLLARRRAQRELAHEVERLRAALATAADQLAASEAAVGGAAAAHRAATEARHQAELACAARNEAATAAQKRIADLNREEAAIAARLLEGERRRSGGVSAQTEQDPAAELARTEAELVHAQAAVEAAESDEEAARQAAQAAGAAQKAQELACREVQGTFKAAVEGMAAATQAASAHRSRAGELAERLDKLKARAAELAAAEAEAAQAVDEADAAQVQARALLERAAAERRERQGRLAEAEEACRKAGEILLRLGEALHRAELAKSRAELSWQQASAALAEVVGEGEEPAAEPLTPQEERQVAAQLSGAESELAELGPINPAAPAEWEAEKKRHDELKAQMTDVQAAARRLRQTIAEIDHSAADALRRTFQAVREAYQRAFHRLFGGGEADLLFTDPENVLASGVELMAQPPGKKPKSLLALSGGERALAGAALLFAFLEVRPAPFCVLDEIDAALDEANLGRFGDMVREFAASTQMILITHRQGTMELAHALFGVTLVEKGVSQVISLRLDGGVDRGQTA